MLRRRIQSVWETRAQPPDIAEQLEALGQGDTMGRAIRFLPPRLRHRRRQQGFCKDNPGHFNGKEVGTAEMRSFPQRWIAGLATDHVFVTRRKCTPRRCDCYLSLLPPYSFPSFPIVQLLTATVSGRHRVSPPQSVVAPSP